MTVNGAVANVLPVSLQCGIQYVEVLCKNRYVGRTFIQPNMRLRQLGVAKKFGVLSDNFVGKRIVLVDDSIVRGNTISPIIKLLKDSGAKEVGSLSYAVGDYVAVLVFSKICRTSLACYGDFQIRFCIEAQ